MRENPVDFLIDKKTDNNNACISEIETQAFNFII